MYNFLVFVSSYQCRIEMDGFNQEMGVLKGPSGKRKMWYFYRVLFELYFLLLLFPEVLFNIQVFFLPVLLLIEERSDG